jgi:serine/threonine-protein kinase RsbW
VVYPFAGVGTSQAFPPAERQYEVVSVLSVPPQPSSAAVVRRCITDELTEAGIASELIDDVLLIATELLSNSLRHAPSLPSHDLVISWELIGRSVRVRVTDGGGHDVPHMRHPDTSETNGRGLTIVNSLADEWGVEDGHGSTSVWATVSA